MHNYFVFEELGRQKHADAIRDAEQFRRLGGEGGRAMREAPGAEGRAAREGAFNKRAQDMAWALLLMLTGVAFLMPGWRVPWAVWLTGVGMLMLGLNMSRWM